MKRVQALTGAKNHTIVLNDAHLEDTVTNIIGAAFGSAGERCMACAVVTVEEGIADEFMAKLQEKAADIKIGNGLDDGVFLGPVIREDNKNARTAILKKASKKERDFFVTDVKTQRKTAISSDRRFLTT